MDSKVAWLQYMGYYQAIRPSKPHRATHGHAMAKCHDCFPWWGESESPADVWHRRNGAQHGYGSVGARAQPRRRPLGLDLRLQAKVKKWIAFLPFLTQIDPNRSKTVSLHFNIEVQWICWDQGFGEAKQTKTPSFLRLHWSSAIAP